MLSTQHVRLITFLILGLRAHSVCRYFLSVSAKNSCSHFRSFLTILWSQFSHFITLHTLTATHHAKFVFVFWLNGQKPRRQCATRHHFVCTQEAAPHRKLCLQSWQTILQKVMTRKYKRFSLDFSFDVSYLVVWMYSKWQRTKFTLLEVVDGLFMCIFVCQ